MHQCLVHKIVKNVVETVRKVKYQEQLLIFSYWVGDTGSKIPPTQFNKQLSETKEFATDEEVMKSKLCLTCCIYDCPH